MAWSIDYNGVGSSGSGDNAWGTLHIQSYRAQAIYADDGLTHETTRHELVGTAIVSRATDTLLNDALKNMRTKLSRQGADLSVKNGNEVFATFSTNDEYLETPRCEFTINEISGAITAIVGFRLIWHDFETLAGDGDTAYHIMSHTWAQQFDINDDGNMLRTVTGMIRARADAPDGDTGVKLGPNVDKYRRLIMPFPDPGFRHKRSTFATDEVGQRLLYTIEWQEYPRKLPGPAKRGAGSFKWIRSIENGPGLMGIKIFDAELEGGHDAAPAILLAQLTKVAQNRIIFAGSNPDFITSIEVTEDDFFNANKVGLRIMARSVGNATDPLQLAGPNISFLDDLVTVGNLTYEFPDAYGTPLVRSVQRALTVPSQSYTKPTFGNVAGELPIARTEAVGQSAEVRIYVAPDAVFEDLEDDLLSTSQAQGVVALKDHIDNPYLSLTIIERIRIVPHVVELASQSLGGNGIPYQTRKPEVFLITEYAFERRGAAPVPSFLLEPVGTILIESSGHVSPGMIDSNNRQNFRGVYTRTLKLMDRQQPGFFLTDTINLGGEIGNIFIRRFILPGGAISHPFDPRVTGLGPERQVFAGGGQLPVPGTKVFPFFTKQYAFV